MKIVRVPYVNAATVQGKAWAPKEDVPQGLPDGPFWRGQGWGLADGRGVLTSHWHTLLDTCPLRCWVVSCLRQFVTEQREPREKVRRKWRWDFLLWGATSQPALHWGSQAPRRLAPPGASLGTRWNQGTNTFPRAVSFQCPRLTNPQHQLAEEKVSKRPQAYLYRVIRKGEFGAERPPLDTQHRK